MIIDWYPRNMDKKILKYIYINIRNKWKQNEKYIEIMIKSLHINILMCNFRLLGFPFAWINGLGSYQ